MANWKINCMEDSYPGLWHTWFREQIVAVGWPPPEYGLRTSKEKPAWSLARRYLMQISPGDKVVVQLKNWRVGRVGTVLRKEIEDSDWKPSVPRQEGNFGEMGRRILVRWDLTTGNFAGNDNTDRAEHRHLLRLDSVGICRDSRATIAEPSNTS